MGRKGVWWKRSVRGVGGRRFHPCKIQQIDHLVDDLPGDHRRSCRVALEQGVVANVIYDPRNTERDTANEVERFTVDDVYSFRPGHLQSKANVFVYLELPERLYRAAQRYSLFELSQRRVVQRLSQFGLPAKNQLEQFFCIGFEICE